jgi:hypothetical protein
MSTDRFIRIPMKKGEVFKLARPKGCVIRAVSGGLWITQSNKIEDTFVNQGEMFVANDEGVLLAEALESGVMSVSYQMNASAAPKNPWAAVVAMVSSLQGA